MAAAPIPSPLEALVEQLVIKLLKRKEKEAVAYPPLPTWLGLTQLPLNCCRTWSGAKKQLSEVSWFVQIELSQVTSSLCSKFCSVSGRAQSKHHGDHGCCCCFHLGWASHSTLFWPGILGGQHLPPTCYATNSICHIVLKSSDLKHNFDLL